MIIRTVIFLLINFGGLAIGALFTSDGVSSDWYGDLNKAPWTPPGWMFGFAWSLIMLCFSLYMAYLWDSVAHKKSIVVLYAFQWGLNVAWNPVFYYLREVTAGLIDIMLLTVLIGYLLYNFWPLLRAKSVLLLPYFIWLLIATSLNAYIFLGN